MRHYRIPVAIAVGLATALAAGATGVAKTTPAVSAKPAAADTSAKLMAEHRGGTLKLLAKAAGGSLDPQVNYTLEYWQLYRATQDGLVTFKAAGGDAAFEIVPDLAVAIPKPTDGGKTWKFQLRKGIKYSNGKSVTPKDVLYTFERIFKVHTPTAGGFYSVIKGADKCLKTPATCDLSKSIVVDSKTNSVTFHLAQPDAEWLDKLAVPHAALLPVGTPNKDLGTKLPPGTGAYTFTKYDPNHELIMERNPHFKQWSADAQPDGYVDKITYSFGQTVEAQITQIQNGTADWTLESPPADRLNELGTKYASQVHINTQLANWYLPMNVNIPPFNNKLARQAVNYAVDRNAAVRILGGPKLAIPSCQVLPAGFPARVDYCPYTKNPGAKWSAPDLEKAKALVKQSGTLGAKVAVTVANDEVNKAMGVYVQSVLNSIGYKASVKAISGNIHFTYIQNTNNKVQISVTQWYQDYPAPSDFLYVLLGCESFHPGSDTSVNMAGFCNKKINNDMKKALSMGISDPEGALKLWTKIDHAMTDEAPLAVLLNPRQINFLSKRVGNFVWSSQYYMMFSKAWVQSCTGPGRLRVAEVVAAAGDVGTARVVGRSPWALAGRRLLRNRVALAALTGFCVIVVSCLAAGWYADSVAHTHPFESSLDGTTIIDGKESPVMVESTGGLGLGVTPIGPTWDIHHYFLGADDQGRDVAARLLYGGRNSLLIALASAALCCFFATIIALTAGFFGGIVDQILSRTLDVIWAFPVFLAAISISTVALTRGISVGPVTLSASSLWLPILIISVIYVPYVARPIRGQVLSVREKEFVEASIGLGASNWRLIFSDVLPNVVTTVIVFFPLMIAINMLTESALSFLSIGVQPPDASWGTIIADGQGLLYTRPWVAIAPGLMIAATVLCLNVLGDGVRDALDPRARLRVGRMGRQ